MSAELEFVDTNLLLYAHDQSAGDERLVSAALLERLEGERAGAISVQVLQELTVTARTKLKPPLPFAEIRGILEDLSDWTVYSPGPSDVMEALRLMEGFTVGLWAAMVIQAARGSAAKTLWTEDLNDGQDYEGVIVRNPFRKR